MSIPQQELDPDLVIREELLSLHAINPFIGNISSARSIMVSGHLSQIVVIENGEPQIIQTGIDPQLAQNTFSKKLEADSRILAILKRYNGVSATSVTELTEYLVITQDVETNQLDIVSIPRYHKLHQNFGFKYKLNEDTLNHNILNTVMPKGTIFADSPTVSKDSEYKFGRPVNIAYLHIPEVTGDGVVISESLAKKYAYRTYETIVVEFGEKSFPLNMYGDDDNYKPFPDIGERVNSDRVTIATRDYETPLSPALTSRSDVKDYSVYFDKPFYAKADGATVVDIKVFHNAKFRKSTYTKTTEQVDKYAKALKQYYRDIINVYTATAKEYYLRYKQDIPVSEQFHRLLLDAYAVVEEARNIRYTYKNDLVDLYRVEITLEYLVAPDVTGSKVTTLHGSDR